MNRKLCSLDTVKLAFSVLISQDNIYISSLLKQLEIIQ